jgi:hypothetical protein
MSEYTEQAEKFLTDHKLTFRAVYVGEDCPTFCDDAAKGDALIVGTFPRKNHIHGSHWRLTLSGEGRGHFTVDFWDSYHDAEIRHIRKTGEVRYSDQARRLGLDPGSTIFEIRRKYKIDPTPTAWVIYDIVASIENDDPSTFEDFCSFCGYDTDPRRAETVCQTFVKQYRQITRFFTAEELNEVQEIN